MRIIFSLFFAITTLSVQAETSPPAQVECQASNQIALKDCLAKLAPQAEQDRKNAESAARVMMKNLDRITGHPAALPAFNQASKAYQSYQHAQCAWVGKSFAGGSGAGVAERACRIDLDRARADELWRFYVQ
ncbi:MAG: hypothetical protein RL571_1194 [Pseudomonadota bacterium]|jgi:uncharacterized protein YecT (DUF1311 family)